VDTPKDPWTDPDPQPGDFDSELDSSDPSQIETHAGNPDTTLSIISAAQLRGPAHEAKKRRFR
jgi:hypothetical protein